ncbi:MAG: hypothetical protein ACRYGA_13780 [Janthinobacterium lividum]
MNALLGYLTENCWQGVLADRRERLAQIEQVRELSVAADFPKQ